MYFREIAATAIALLVMTGCGVHANTTAPGNSEKNSQPFLGLATSVSTLTPNQSVGITITASSIPLSSITLSVNCRSSQCGTLNGNTYTAPSSASSGLTVEVTASSSAASVSPATLQLTIVEPPLIASITPNIITSGTTESVEIAGSGFLASNVVLNSSLNGLPATINSTRIVSDTSIEVSITAPPGEAGILGIVVQNPAYPSVVSSPANVFVSPTQPSPSLALPVFEIGAFGASGSTQTYSCSGKAGTNVLVCSQTSLDFLVGQGIRIVAAGGLPHATVPTKAPTITRQGSNEVGSHTYCYVESTIDALGGITTPTPRSCISNEPDLTYSTTYNGLGGIDTSCASDGYLWYVSEDGGPYYLVSVSGAMDTGQQPGDRGGLPNKLPVGNPNIAKNEDQFTIVAAVSGSQITLQDPLISSVTLTLVDHDDTNAVQEAINSAVSAGGGVIQFGRGTFNLRRPSFDSSPSSYPNVTTSYSENPWWYGDTYLDIPNGATGNIYLEGEGSDTVLQTPPDHGAYTTLIWIGQFGRPAFSPYTSIRINPVDKGSNTLTLASSADSAKLQVGDDIWLYSGSYGTTASPPCVDIDGWPGGQCHYSELNSIASVDGRIITLAYPISKKYYDDGINSFGLVKLPVTPHNVGIQNLTINTYNTITGTGMVDGLLIDRVVINGSISHGVFGGGFKRDVLISSSSWGFGIGDASWMATDEYDQFTNVAFINNTISGYAAPGAEGQSLMARIYATEGSSQFVFWKNVFQNASVYFQETTDDIFKDNEVDNGILDVGESYNPFQHNLAWSYLQNAGVVSFASQDKLLIDNNSFNITSAYTPAWVINVGHFTSAEIANNVITHDGPSSGAMIVSGGGQIIGNTVTIKSSLSRQSWAVAAVPDEGPGIPPAAFQIQGNLVNAPALTAGILVVNSGFKDRAPVCITGNSVNIQLGQPVSIESQSNTTLTCQ